MNVVGQNLKQRDNGARESMNRSFERERTPDEISEPKMDKKLRRVVFRRKNSRSNVVTLDDQDIDVASDNF